MKRVLAWVGLVGVMVILAVMLFISGREHKVFIENKKIDGHTPMKKIVYIIDGGKKVTIKKNKKKAAKLKGPNHEITLKYEKDGQEVELTKNFKIGALSEGKISIPKLLAEEDGWFESYKPEKKKSKKK